jgi:DNA-binding response OmpR family regulator
MARILVVDDDALVAQTIRHTLVAGGHTVIVADGGATALPAIETFAFDLVFIDIIMPGTNGLDVIKQVRASAPDVPIIAMSGYAFIGGSSDRDYLTLARQLGADLCLQKPFKPRELLAAAELLTDGADEPPRPGTGTAGGGTTRRMQ